jgi:putative transposase
MAQEITILQPSTYYHIYNRGNNKEVIFKEEKNYVYFITLFEKHILPFAELFAYNLLPNHFHFFIKTKNIPENKTEKCFTQAFSNFFNAYAKAINKSYNRTGSLFQEKFRRKKINSNEYFTAILLYIHCNAQKHGLVRHFATYPYSSYQNYINNTYDKLSKTEILEWFGGMDRFKNQHEAYRLDLAVRNFILEHEDDDY